MKEAVAAGFSEPTEWLIAAWIESFPHLKDRILKAAADAATEYFQWEEQQRAAKLQAESRKASADAVRSQYETAAKTVSDINQHLPTLFELAKGKKHVVEFGVRSGETTKTFLAAGVQQLTSYDVIAGSAPGVVSLDGQKWVKNFGPEVGDSLKASFDQCDGLMIDSKHTADHVFAELTMHFAKVAADGWIALHDTQSPWGRQDDDGGKGGGVVTGIERFIAAHPEWHIAAEYKNNHGLMVLRRKRA